MGAIEDRRVVVTGVGAVSPLGNDAASTWEGMKAGRSGVRLLENMDTTDYTVKIGGEVQGFDPKPFFSNPKDARRRAWAPRGLSERLKPRMWIPRISRHRA